MDLVSIEHRGPVAVLTLNRAEALNALNKATLEALCARCDEIAGDGDVQFEDRHHRLINHLTSLATFGDDTGEQHYHGLDPRQDDEFIYNDIRITRSGGTQQSATDAASKTKFGPSSLTRTGLLMSTDNEASDQANVVHDEDFLADGIIRLRKEQMGYDVSRQIVIDKMRTTKHSKKTYEYDIMDDGIQIVGKRK